MFKILVTGSSGFVGEELIDKLTKSNYSVIGIDNFEPSDLEKKKYELKNFFFEKADIRNNLKNLDKIFKKYKPQIIVHCASKILDTNDKKVVWDTNYFATRDILKLSIEHKIKKFIFVSTFSIFQKSYDFPVDENEPPSYKTVYGETKFKTEKLIMESKFEGDICILRCPIILGKHRSFRFGVLFSMIKNNFNVPLIGECKNKISFVHVADVCKAIELFFNVNGKYIFNVAADESEEFQLILRRLINKTNSKSKLRFFNKFLGNLLFDIAVFFRLIPYTSYHRKIFNYSIVLNTSKIKKVLKWKPDYSIEKMFYENYLNFDKVKNENQDSFSKKKAKEGLIGIIKYFI